MNRPTPTDLDLAALESAALAPLARGLIGSEVLRIAAEVRALAAQGKPICNLTVGDFDSSQFPAPPSLIAGIQPRPSSTPWRRDSPAVRK